MKKELTILNDLRKEEKIYCFAYSRSPIKETICNRETWKYRNPNGYLSSQMKTLYDQNTYFPDAVEESKNLPRHSW